MKNKKVIHIIILVIMALLISGTVYMKYYLASSNFDEFIFNSTSVGSSDFTLIYGIIKLCLPITIILSIIFYIIFYGFKTKRKTISPINHISKHKLIYTIILSICSVAAFFESYRLFEYLIDMSQKSNIIEDNYIDPKETKISFKNKKRNLIVIYVESLENTLFTKEQGGLWDYEIIPELYTLLNDEDTIVFNKNYNGMHMLQGTSYTSAAVAANNTGLPLKIGINRQGYKKGNFMNGAYSLGEILKENGYTNEVISGAKTSFGGLDNFYKVHGDYNIIDLDSLADYGYSITKSGYGKWGFNDKYLFELAEQRLDVLTKEDKPFNLQLITIDTHFTDGFVGDYSLTKYDRQYENAYATTSKLIYEFVNYVKEQPYYKDTTIVITGDHLLMQSNFVNDHMFKNRTIYNCIINPIDKSIPSDNRVYTAIDMYPTIINSIGGEIEGNKLGLGVNLYSNEKTLIETYGINKLDKELRKKSNYYNKNILKESRK